MPRTSEVRGTSLALDLRGWLLYNTCMAPRKPSLTGTRHLLPFDKLSPLDFERLCLWLVQRG